MHALAAIYVMREIMSVKEFQVIQDRLDRLQVRIVPEADYSRGTSAAIVSGFRTLFGSEVSVTIDLVDAIQCEPSGKFRYVISRVADEYLATTLGHP